MNQTQKKTHITTMSRFFSRTVLEARATIFMNSPIGVLKSSRQDSIGRLPLRLTGDNRSGPSFRPVVPAGNQAPENGLYPFGKLPPAHGMLGNPFDLVRILQAPFDKSTGLLQGALPPFLERFVAVVAQAHGLPGK